MNGYFSIVILGIVLFYVVWFLGWLLERLAHLNLQTTHDPGSRAWYALVGPGVALHESSHALGCIFTRSEIVEFKPINVSVEGDQVVLGYVKYRNPKSTIKRAVINLAPVAVSLTLLTFFALGITYLVPSSPGIGGQALDLLDELIWLKANPTLLADPIYPLGLIGDFVYSFFYTFAGLTVVNPLFWIVAFLAMTIMFSNAPSDVDIINARDGLKYIMVFNIIWLGVAFFIPQAGWLLFGLYELLAVMFALGLVFAGIGYGFFIMISSMAKLKTPFNIFPILITLIGGVLMWYFGFGTAAFQTVVCIGIFMAVVIPLLFVKQLRR
ncbi:MAG: hypothetical protein GF411_15795 [Candidatus Lokiarchaeota archaeon]|nr:hypothetical protein [Candidatus Lokiarchaeota archaeon]